SIEELKLVEKIQNHLLDAAEKKSEIPKQAIAGLKQALSEWPANTASDALHKESSAFRAYCSERSNRAWNDQPMAQKEAMLKGYLNRLERRALDLDEGDVQEIETLTLALIAERPLPAPPVGEARETLLGKAVEGLEGKTDQERVQILGEAIARTIPSGTWNEETLLNIAQQLTANEDPQTQEALGKVIARLQKENDPQGVFRPERPLTREVPGQEQMKWVPNEELRLDPDPGKLFGMEESELSIPLHDPKTIHVTARTMRIGDGGHQLEVCCARRKGVVFEAIATPKAMCEDFAVMEEVTVQLPSGRSVQVPFTAVLDGGGGHALAQFGSSHLADAFQRHLQQLVGAYGALTPSLVAVAMKRADAELFGRAPGTSDPYPGAAYQQLRANHARIQEELGVSRDQFMGAAQNSFGKEWHHCPLEIHQIIMSGEFKAELKTAYDIGGRVYDLEKQEDAFRLQELYELAASTVEKIECQANMNAYLVDDRGEVICVDVNRGDSISFYTGSGSGDDEWLALSEVRPPFDQTVSSHRVGEGLVVSSCDGHREKLSHQQLAKWDGEHFGGSARDYAVNTSQASAQFGGGDDVTIIAARLL
ncbi:MAG: hypothetical protein KDK78_10375, partial [Chlamydiia bacterium]|nr:hypothetical protein [Chlamydiia bacterium]